MTRKAFLLICIVPFIQLKAQESDHFTNEARTLKKFGLQIDENYLWLEEDEVKKDRWLEYQESLNLDLLGKSSFSKFGRLTFDSDFLERTTPSHEFRLSQSVDQPSILQYKNKSSNHFKTIFKAKDYAKSEKDYPVVENYWAHPNLPYVIIALSHSGSDWFEFLMFNLGTSEVRYTIEGIRTPAIYFTKKGFIYEKFDIPTNEIIDVPTNQSLSVHQLETSANDDRILFQNVDKESVKSFTWNYIAGKFFIRHPVKIGKELKEGITCVDPKITGITNPFFLFESKFRVDFDLVFLKDNIIYYRTNLKDPNYEIIGFDFEQVNSYSSYVDPHKEVLTEATYLGGGYIGLTYLQYGKYVGVIHNENTKKQIVLELPPGVRVSFDNYDSEKNTIGYTQHHHYLPSKYWEISLQTLKSNTLRGFYIKNGIELKSEITNFRNRDGKLVPLQLYYASNKIKKGKPSPVFMEVYGGYGTIIHPGYNFEYYSIIRSGGILAIPGIRGGGDLGTSWALEGRGLNKINAINDVIDASEYLIAQQWTDSDHLILSGKSHGAFIVTAAAVFKPELFKAVVAEAGPLDLIRSSKFSVGYKELNLREFGDPNDSIDFINLLKLSPIHNLKSRVEYPSFLLITGINDTRVPSSHSFRFKALLDDYSLNEFNILHTTRFGHGGELVRKEYVKNLSLKFEFLYQLTGHKFWK